MYTTIKRIGFTLAFATLMAGCTQQPAVQNASTTPTPTPTAPQVQDQKAAVTIVAPEPAPSTTQTEPSASTTPAAPAVKSDIPASNPALAPKSEKQSVTISGFKFSPAAITVSAGTTVTWTNEDSVPHNVTADDGSFASETLTTGKSYSHIFSTSGTYSYTCTIHPTMKATITVK